MAQLLSPGIIVLGIYIASAIYIHYRGKVRFKFLRQLSDHSTIMAPVNVLMYLFSAVPNKPYVDTGLFPELEPLKTHWKVIRDEALALSADSQIKASDKLDDMGFNSFFKVGWKRFYLQWYGSALPSAQNLCPRTVALLADIPQVKGAMFAMLPPDGALGGHRDPYAGSLRYHLGLVTSNADDCRIFVDDEPYSWRDGEAVLFDETYVHRAYNHSQVDRIVLFADIERPLNNPVARWFNKVFGRIVVAASATRNLPGDKLGLFNRLFAAVYGFGQLGKRIKAWHRPTYYTLKYLLIIGIIYGLFF